MGSTLGKRRFALAGALAFTALLTVSACSSSDVGSSATTTKPGSSATTGGGAGTGSSGGKTTTTTAPSASTKPGGSATTAASSTTSPPDAESFSGPAMGQESEGPEISLSRSVSTVRSFSAPGLEVECNPITGVAEPELRTIDVTIPSMPVDADGNVDYVGVGKDKYNPEVNGTFDDKNRFIGSLYISYEDGNLVCGHTFSFVLN